MNAASDDVIQVVQQHLPLSSLLTLSRTSTRYVVRSGTIEARLYDMLHWQTKFSTPQISHQYNALHIEEFGTSYKCLLMLYNSRAYLHSSPVVHVFSRLPNIFELLFTENCGVDPELIHKILFLMKENNTINAIFNFNNFRWLKRPSHPNQHIGPILTLIQHLKINCNAIVSNEPAWVLLRFHETPLFTVG